jgi:hypothetical protein
MSVSDTEPEILLKLLSKLLKNLIYLFWKLPAQVLDKKFNFQYSQYTTYLA